MTLTLQSKTEFATQKLGMLTTHHIDEERSTEALLSTKVSEIATNAITKTS